MIVAFAKSYAQNISSSSYALDIFKKMAQWESSLVPQCMPFK